MVVVEFLLQFLAQLVITHCADSPTVEPKLRDMIGEVGWSATEFLSIWQHVKESFANTYY